MRFLFATVVLVLAVSGGECGFLSTFMENIPFFGNHANSTQVPIPVNSTSEANATVQIKNSTVAQPCVPPQTLSPTLQALQKQLPSEFAALITPQNVNALEELGTLAGLATSAATGNPIAIVKLVFFLTSPANPIPTLFNMTKEIVPLIKPEELTHSLVNLVNSTSTNAKQDVQQFTQNFLHYFSKNQTVV